MKRRTFIKVLVLDAAAAAVAVPIRGQIVPYTFSDPQIYFKTGGLPICNAYDDCESYTLTADVNGLNGGTCWGGPYVDGYPGIGLGCGDDLESYAVAVLLDGLNGGIGWFLFWGGAYVGTDLLVQDDMESYTVAANLDGLNGGTSSSPFWGGPYVSR